MAGKKYLNGVMISAIIISGIIGICMHLCMIYL